MCLATSVKITWSPLYSSIELLRLRTLYQPSSYEYIGYSSAEDNWRDEVQGSYFKCPMAGRYCMVEQPLKAETVDHLVCSFSLISGGCMTSCWTPVG